MEAQKMVLFGLHQIEGIGWKSIEKLMNSGVSLTHIPQMSRSQLQLILGDTHKAGLIKQTLSDTFIQRRMQLYQQKGIEWITIWDEAYPALLKEIANPPWVLYYRGDPSLLNMNGIAIVGTRNPTHYGKKVTEKIAEQLCQYELCIVSGMARGIDSAAHLGAMQVDGKTIAVLGTAIDEIYPPEHAELYQRISRHGLVVSEYPIGTRSHPGLFPIRNRIIAGLSLGTLIVEATEKSGSLITADYALEQSRDVFAVPGPITSPKSKGTLRLIQQGAKMVIDAKDIIEEYIHMLNIHDKRSSRETSTSVLNEDERNIIKLLSFEPMTIDEIAEFSKIPFGHLHSILLSLSVKNEIAYLPNQGYVRVNSF